MGKKAQSKGGEAPEEVKGGAAQAENETEQETAGREAESEAPVSEAGALQKELDDARDMLLRLKAEYANFRKRSEKEKLDAFSFATAAAVKELLPVIDNLERALNNGSEDYEALKKGVEMTYNGVVDSFKKLKVETFAEKGDVFDPQLHNAVMHIDSDEYKAGEIVEVYQKGFRLGGKVIRPAMVKTAN